MILSGYLRKTVIILFLINIFFSDAFAHGPLNDTLEFDNFEAQVKQLLPDSLKKVDSLASLLIDKYSGTADSIEGMGWFYRAEAAYYAGRFDQSGDYYERSDSLLDSFKNMEQKAIVLNNLGLTRYFKERYNDALEAFLKSAEFEKQLGNEYGFAQCLHNIALVQDKAGRFNSAETYFSHAMDLFYEMDSLADAAAVCNDYAIYLSGRGLNEEAISKYSEALEIYQELDDAEGEAKVKCNIGALFLYEKEYLNSALHLEQALNFFKEQGNPSYLINIYSLFGDLYYEQDRTALAVVFYERADNMARQKGWDNLRQKNLYSLFKALKAEQEYKEAMETLEIYSQFKDSLIVANKGYLETTLDNEIKTELMEKELKLARGKVRERNMMLIILGLIFVLGVVAWILYGRSKLLRNEREKQLMQHRITRMEMNPDFIFNSLFSVQSYIMEENMEEALDYLNDIAHLMRKILDFSNMDYILLEDELDLLDKYLKVQCRRFYKKINCDVSSQLISGSKFLMVPPMLVRPLIDELFSRGRTRDYNCPALAVSYEQKENQLEVTLETRNVLVGNEISSESLDVINERLALLRKVHKTGKSHVDFVDIIDKGKKAGTRIRFCLPLINST